MNRKRRWKIHTATRILAGALALAWGIPAAAADSSAAPIRRNADGTRVPEAWSRLSRDAAGLAVTLRTSQLPARTETTVWWIIYNHPEACTGRSANARCSAVDLGNAAAQPAVVYGTHQAIEPDGRGVFEARLKAGDSTGVVLGPGLLRPRGAEIHLQLVSCVCAGDPAFVAGVGYRPCTDTQFAVHRA